MSTPTTPTPGPVAAIETDVENVLHGIEQRAEALEAGAEGFVERHFAPKVAHLLAFEEQHLSNLAALQAGLVEFAEAIAGPNAAPEVLAAIAAIKAASAEANTLAAAFLAFMAKHAPKSQTEPVAKAS